jgi:hypothetical protein
MWAEEKLLSLNREEWMRCEFIHEFMSETMPPDPFFSEKDVYSPIHVCVAAGLFLIAIETVGRNTIPHRP